MKGASEYARRLKRFLAPLRRQQRRAPGSRQAPADAEIIEEVLLAILEEGTSRAAARAALASAMEWAVDYNDLRVTPLRDLLRMLNRSLPQAKEKAQRISQVLNHIFDKKNSLNINSLRDQPIREVRQFLSLLDGVTPFVSAAVIRRCVGGHAIPVDEVLEEFLKDQELAPAEVGPIELQGFLERHVLAADSPLFLTVVRSRALAHHRRARARAARGAAKKLALSATEAKEGPAPTRKTQSKTPTSRGGRPAGRGKTASTSRARGKATSRRPAAKHGSR